MDTKVLTETSAIAARRAQSAGAPHQKHTGIFAVDLSASTERTRLRLPDDLALETWCRIGDQILAVSDSSAWWIGDWLVFGQRKYRDRYQRAMKETLLDYQTLRNYAWVARKFAPQRRRENLTFQHHMEVASLPEDQQDHWLDFAARLKWSKTELRRQIRASTAPDDAPAARPEVSLSLRLEEARVKRWEQAARRSSKSLTEWISSVLDSAA
ncbi:LmbU family transcriptional regulator [Streptomyces sp. NPDC051907]|uniref:LmbU family transcriptional regulator n=1 Tax=Streptomyces sp. NPDC051907 TaxID=3155284 RepID=UPI00342C65F6